MQYLKYYSVECNFWNKYRKWVPLNDIWNHRIMKSLLKALQKKKKKKSRKSFSLIFFLEKKKGLYKVLTTKCDLLNS